ncbi:MAG TPA: TonB-dependent receptor [Blastocatellia bacterium]|nr:TonB-dependent receptor [Blastocatellia bacterium]
MRLSKRTIFFTLACVALCGASVFGQATSGVISGTLLDPQGAALPGATVKIKNLETGATREVKSDSSGFYRVTGLAPGFYEAQASAEGFTSETRGNLALTVAEAIVVNFNLKVGAARENVTVTVQTVAVETTGATLSGLVDEKKIRDLPLDGRDVTQLIFLQPGVVESRGSAQSSNTGRGPRFSVGGARPSQNLFQLDGTTLNDALNNTPGSAQGLLIGVETIKEFRVLTNAFSAEYSRAAGGVFIAVTKSGTNDIHGSLFEFLRNDSLDARTFFDRCSSVNPNCDGGGKPEFRRNQFGASLGGPIIKNKTFFFGSYEGLREFKGISTVALVPNDNARQGILPTGKVTINPRSAPLIDLFPRANGAVFSDGTAEFIGVTPRISNGDFFSVRVDHQLSASDSLFVRYLFDDSEQTLVRFFPQYPNLSLNRKQVATIEERKIIGSNIVNEARFSFNRSTPSELVPDPGSSVSLVAGRPLGEVNVTGLSPVGTDRTNPKLFFQNNYQAADNLSINLGRNNVKMGFSYDRFQFNGRSESRTRGRLRFRSVSDLLTFRVQNLEGSTFDSDFVRGFRQSLFGFFFQDDFKVTPRLTLNLGARYDYVTSPDEVNGKIANLRNVTDTTVTVGGDFFKTTKSGIAPRFGFAYDVFGNGRTAIRGGVGVFHEVPLFNAYRSAAFGSLPFINTSALSASRVTSLPIPSSAFANPGGALLTESITFDLHPTYLIQYNLNIQQEAFGAVMTFAYVGSRGVNLLGQGDINTAIPQILPDGSAFFPNATRRNPSFSTIRSQIQGFSSNYNGLNVSVNRRFGKGLQFQASYTFGKSLDNRSGNSGRQEYNNGQARTFDPYNRGLDYGRSDFDVRHNFTANLTYDLPFGRNLDGFAGAAIRGWQINSIVKLASGIPFTPLVAGDPDGDGTDDNAARADLVGDPNAGPRTVEQWFNLAAFAQPRAGFRGGAGRNIVDGPNFKTVDFSLNKSFALSERINLQFRIETFNLLNHTNFDLPSNSDDGATLFIPGAGRINNIVGNAREIQLGLKLVF